MRSQFTTSLQINFRSEDPSDFLTEKLRIWNTAESGHINKEAELKTDEDSWDDDAANLWS